MKDLVAGDIVELNSGGPNMTVLDVPDGGGDVEVTWLNGGQYEVDKFPRVCLRFIRAVEPEGA